MDLYEHIDMLLQSKNLSRRQLANMANIPPSTFQSLMERKRGMTVEILLKISDAMNVPLDELIGIDNEEKTRKNSSNVESTALEEENNPEILETATWLQDLLIKAGWVKPGEDLSDKQYRLLRAIILLLQEGMEPQ